MDDLEIARGFLLHSLKKSVYTGSWLEISSYWTWEVYNWLCYCCFWLGDYRDALKWALKAKEYLPESKMIEQNLHASMEMIRNESEF